jgi:hypothetical protein
MLAIVPPAAPGAAPIATGLVFATWVSNVVLVTYVHTCSIHFGQVNELTWLSLQAKCFAGHDGLHCRFYDRDAKSFLPYASTYGSIWISFSRERKAFQSCSGRIQAGYRPFVTDSSRRDTLIRNDEESDFQVGNGNKRG